MLFVHLAIFHQMAVFVKNLLSDVVNDIAWETEIWIAEMPSHMIHFNGDKFLGPG
jgi:hypothetical protein